MDTNNLVSSLQLMNARHARGIATQGSAEQRLSLLAGMQVGVGVKVLDTVTGSPVEVLSVGVVYLPEEALNAV